MLSNTKPSYLRQTNSEGCGGLNPCRKGFPIENEARRDGVGDQVFKLGKKKKQNQKKKKKKEGNISTSKVFVFSP